MNTDSHKGDRMTRPATITIDGQQYDAVTGLRVDSKAPVTVRKVPATSLHATPQHSTTLRRETTKPPTVQRTAIGRHKSVKHIDIISTHSSVRKFAPHPVEAIRPKSMDIGPITHPHVAKAHARSAAKAQPLSASLSATAIKAEAIKTAVANTHKKPLLRGRIQPRQRAVSILSATLAVMLIGGYVTYLNMPSLSVRVAAAQAGIDANYPNYRPDGYSLNGPVTYADGRVSMNFKANAGVQDFTVTQSKSGWDSNAVLDNYVAPKAGSSYIPYTERGLTIYTYDNNAAWVNGGILYTVEGDAPLSSEQIRRIATSLL